MTVWPDGDESAEIPSCLRGLTAQELSQLPRLTAHEVNAALEAGQNERRLEEAAGPASIVAKYPLNCEQIECDEGPGHALKLFGPIKCRPVQASELGGDLDGIVEALDDAITSGEIDLAWGDYNSPMVVKREGADEAFAAFLDQWILVKAHVNEGDE